MTQLIVTAGIPLLGAALALGFPQLLTKKNLSDPENEKFKKRLSFAGILLLVAAILILLSQLGSLGISRNALNALKHDFLPEVVEGMNERMPQRIDEYTVLERVSSSGNTLSYHYTVSEFSSFDLQRTEFSKIMRDNAVQNFKSNPKTKLFQEKGVSIRFVYEDHESSLLADFTILPEEYK